MKPKPILPFVTTPGLTVAYNRLREVASAPVDVTTAVTIIYGASGTGKTELFRKVRRELAWDGPAAEFTHRILGGEGPVSFDPQRIADLMEKIGFLNQESEEEAEAVLSILRERKRQGGYGVLDKVPSTVLWDWFHFITEQLGYPRPDPVACLPLWGIAGSVKTRYPIILEARINDRPHQLDRKILEALGQHGRPHYYFAQIRLIDLLKRMPVVLIVDEADMLHGDSLHALRQLGDYSGTPLVLGGTDRLRTRLLSHPDLRPLATRVGMRIELGSVSLPDLRRSLPGMEDEIVVEVFRQGGERFRTICIILGGLQKFQAANPGRRISREVVQTVAKRVLSAMGVTAAKPSRRTERELVFTPEDLGEELGDGAARSDPEEAQPAVARAMRKAG